MKKTFNTTGPCNSKKHFMVDLSDKVEKVKTLIDAGKYFVINRPRQYGKTTLISQISKNISDRYIVIRSSFEGIGDIFFSREDIFSNEILELFAESLFYSEEKYSIRLKELGKGVNTIKALSKAIATFVKECEKPVVLIIDEVDKCSHNQLFLNFLGMLRSKFIYANDDLDYTFHSVILAGVYDIKNLKLKLRADEEKRYNSPWNIAVNFNVDMSFTSYEIKTMLDKYKSANNIELDSMIMSEELHFYTNGYPFLVSRLCQIMDEDLNYHESFSWNKESLHSAIKLLLQENNTIFDDLTKNMENNNELREYIIDLLINGDERTFNIDNPLINLGVVFGYFINEDGRVKLSNRIFQQRLYNYLSSKLENKSYITKYNFRENFTVNGGLDFEKILLRFQQFVKEQYSTIDSNFIEREGRLLFLAFIKPIINGIGFDFKEVQISEEKRLDIVVTYLSNKYLTELKIWRGQEYHKKGLKQLSNYMDIQGLNTSYLVIYNFNKNKVYKNEKVSFEGKEIFIVWV